MPGIVAAAACIPRYRLPREVIASEWGTTAAGGEKAVANHDEDSLTLAVNAALGLGVDGPPADAVYFATTTSPWAEKQAAATIAAVLDLPPAARTLDFTGTLRAGTSAMLAGLDAIAGGSASRVLVTAGDCRIAEPDSPAEQSFWTTLGDTGAVQPLLMLAAALERAKAGDLILVVGYGDGADAVVLRATGAAIPADHGVARQIEVKRTLPSYGRYARFRKLVRKETVATESSSPVILWRDRKQLLPLYGGRCARCGTVQFPKHRICVECADANGLEEVRLARRGRLFTFTNDYLTESPDPPVTHAVVELDGGGRLYVQLTDCER